LFSPKYLPSSSSEISAPLLDKSSPKTLPAPEEEKTLLIPSKYLANSLEPEASAKKLRIFSSLISSSTS
jgi:hypothetical protein